jgi:hypothetical protein
MVGHALAGRFDVCALAECFETHERQAVAAAWPEPATAAGVGRGRIRTTNSGLFTIVDPRRADLTYRARMAFKAGGDVRDADTFATKGALLTRVRQVGSPGQRRRRAHEGRAELDVVSTHLFAGGDFLPVPGSANRSRHHGVRMEQVDELVEFVGREHDPMVPLLLVGDFNVAAHDADPDLDDPAERYRDLLDHLAPLGVTDLWPELGLGPGRTSGFGTRTPASDPADPDRVLDQPEDRDAEPGFERIDYLFLAQPADRARARAERPRRWAFPRPDQHAGPSDALSDHLALSVMVHIDPP